MRRTLVCLALLVLAGCSKPSPPGTVPGAKKPTTPAEVRKAAEGKTPREVMQALGKPSTTWNASDDLDDPAYKGTWTYYDVATDPVTGKPAAALVRFKDGKVVEVRF